MRLLNLLSFSLLASMFSFNVTYADYDELYYAEELAKDYKSRCKPNPQGLDCLVNEAYVRIILGYGIDDIQDLLVSESSEDMYNALRSNADRILGLMGNEEKNKNLIDDACSDIVDIYIYGRSLSDNLSHKQTDAYRDYTCFKHMPPPKLKVLDDIY